MTAPLNLDALQATLRHHREDGDAYGAEAVEWYNDTIPALIQEVRRLRALIDSGSFICTKCDEELSWYPEDAPHADHCVWYKAP